MNPTKKQLAVLKALNPYVANTTYEEAAKELEISVSAVRDRMYRLKKRCPEIYEKFKQLHKNMSEGQEAVNKANIVDPKDFNYFNIKESF